MSEFTDAYIACLKEQSENYRKQLHNYDCRTEDIQAYNNQAYLNLVNIMNKQLKIK